MKLFPVGEYIPFGPCGYCYNHLASCTKKRAIKKLLKERRAEKYGRDWESYLKEGYTIEFFRWDGTE